MKQQSNSGHRNFSLYCKRNLSHAKKMIPIYKNLENCEKRHKKNPLSKKKKTTRTPAIWRIFFQCCISTAPYRYYYIHIPQLCKSRFLPKLSCFPLLLFLFISQFFCTREQRDLPWFLQAMPRTTPQPTPRGPPGPPPQDPKVAPLMKKKKCAQLLCSRWSILRQLISEYAI